MWKLHPILIQWPGRTSAFWLIEFYATYMDIYINACTFRLKIWRIIFVFFCRRMGPPHHRSKVKKKRKATCIWIKCHLLPLLFTPRFQSLIRVSVHENVHKHAYSLLQSDSVCRCSCGVLHTIALNSCRTKQVLLFLLSALCWSWLCAHRHTTVKFW